MVTRLILLLGLSSFVAACAAETGSISRANKGHIFDRSLVQYAIRDGNMLTTIHADFEGMEGATVSAVAAGLQMPPRFSPADFVAAPPSAVVGAQRIVLLINPAEISWSGRHACSTDKPLSVKPIAGNSTVVAAFCSTDRVISEVRAVLPNKFSGVTGLTAFLNDVIAELLPRKVSAAPRGR